MKYLGDREFLVAREDEIKRGETTDIYFIRTMEILRSMGKDKVNVSMEITPGKLPRGWSWGILAGTIEAINLFKGLDVDLYLMREGTIFKPYDDNGFRMPIGYIVGEYGVFGIYETPLLGLLCEASGVATYSAHLRVKAWGKMLLSFGARRMHPSVTPLIDYAAYIAGFDGVSSVLSAKILGVEPIGTMPHALILIIGDQVEAWRAFDKYIDRRVRRIALIDTLFDEKIEGIMAAEALGEKLYGVRIDTPTSRRGDIKDIIRELRWELDIRGFKDVKIFVSGGVNIDNIGEMIEAGADGFGVGTSVSNAPTIDYALDIVEIEGEPIAKRGKLSGVKQVYRCIDCYSYVVRPRGSTLDKCNRCGGRVEELINKVLEGGRIVTKLWRPSETREYVLKQISKIRELGWGYE